MNEQDSNNENKPKQNTKISLSEYLDLVMAAVNTIVIIFIFALIRNGIISLVFLGLILLSVLVIGTILTFIKRNPFYIYFCYGLTLCGVLGNFIGFTTNGILWIVFILQGFYVYKIIEFNFFYQQYTERSQYYVTRKKSQKQIIEEKRREELLEKHRKNIETKFKFNSIAMISLCCSIGLFLSLIFSA